MFSKLDYVDTSVWLGSIVEDSFNCRKYLQTLGYKQHNKGVISSFVMGEMLEKVLKLKHKDYWMEKAIKESILDTLRERVEELTHSERLSLFRLKDYVIDCRLIRELISIERDLSYDDALHLSMAIKRGCGRFVTTETLFNVEDSRGSKVLVTRLKREYSIEPLCLDKETA